MPIVRISLGSSTATEPREVGACVYMAMRETIGIPEGDNFQVITRHSADELIYDPSFFGIERTSGFMIIEITLARGRTDSTKQALFARITALLEERCGVRPADVMLALHEAGLADLSLGLGRAQFVENPPLRLQTINSEGESS